MDVALEAPRLWRERRTKKLNVLLTYARMGHIERTTRPTWTRCSDRQERLEPRGLGVGSSPESRAHLTGTPVPRALERLT